MSIICIKVAVNEREESTNNQDINLYVIDELSITQLLQNTRLLCLIQSGATPRSPF